MRPTKPTPNALRTKKMRPRRGEGGPSDAKHRHIKSNIKRYPDTGDPWTHQTKDNPHATTNHPNLSYRNYVAASNSKQYVNGSVGMVGQTIYITN